MVAARACVPKPWGNWEDPYVGSVCGSQSAWWFPQWVWSQWASVNGNPSWPPGLWHPAPHLIWLQQDPVQAVTGAIGQSQALSYCRLHMDGVVPVSAWMLLSLVTQDWTPCQGEVTQQEKEDQSSHGLPDNPHLTRTLEPKGMISPRTIQS